MRIEQGGVVVVIGPSGSGKSTMLRCINRLEGVSRGTLLLIFFAHFCSAGGGPENERICLDGSRAYSVRIGHAFGNCAQRLNVHRKRTNRGRPLFRAALLKDTSLATIVALPELVHNMNIVQSQNVNYILPTFLLVGALYFVVNFILSRVAKRLELKRT